MTFDPFDVVVTPFPFADRAATVVRPGIILTDSAFACASGVALVAMVTSARHSSWPWDTPIENLAAAGLRVPCMIRMKLNSIDVTLIERKIGQLAADDTSNLKRGLAGLLPHMLGT